MVFDPYKPVESVLDEVSSSAASLLRKAVANPRQALIGAAAAAVAPLFIQNDERGYGKSSLITTPLVAAATITGPQAFQAARDLSHRMINFSRQARNQVARQAGVLSWEDLHSMKGTFHRGEMFLSQYEKAAKDYFNTGLSQEKLNKNLARQVRSVRTQFQRYLKNGSNQALLANAVFAENYRAMGARELARFGHQPTVPEWSWRDMWRIVHNRSGNEGFLRGMSFRLQQMGRLQDQGGSFSAADVLQRGARDDFGDPILSKVRYRDFTRSPHFQDLLQAQRPDLYNELQAAFSAGKLNSARDRVILGALGSADDTGIIAGVRVIRQGHRPLDVYVQQSDGSVRMGEGFSRLGVSRKVLDLEMDQKLPADVFAIRAIGDDIEEVRDTLNKAQFGGYIDRADDTFQTIAAGEHFTHQLDPGTIHARSQQVLLRGLEGLSAKQREDALIQAMAKHHLIKTWSENSLAKGVLEEAGLGDVSPGGVYDPSKQARQLRGLKPIHAADPIHGVRFSGSHAPFSRTNYWENVRPGLVMPEFGTNIGGVSAGLKSLVGDLPNKKKFLYDAQVKDSALANIVRDLRAHGQEPTPGQAEKIWVQVRDYLRQNNNLSRIKKIGYLGEGDHLVLGRHLPMAVAEKTYYVHQVRLKDLKEGQSFGRNTLLGFLNGTAITPSGTNNRLIGAKAMEDGRVALRVNEEGYAGIAKTDAHTKGLNISTHRGESTAIRDFVNRYGAAAGTGAYLPEDTEMLTVFHYSQNKANIGEQTLNLGASLLRRLQSTGELHEAGVHQNALAGLGFRYDDGTLVEDVNAFRSLSYEQKQARLQEAMDIVNDMFDQVGGRIRSSQIRGDDFLQHYSASRDPLIDYFHKNASPVNAMFWNSLEQNVPGEAALTYDMFGHLYARGYHGVIKDLKANSQIEGDVGQTRDVMAYLDKGDFSQPLGAALSPEQAVPGYDGSLRLSQAADRADTIFDPAHPLAQSNFSIKLSDGTHVPVLGHEAYGGKINRYGAGHLSTNARESALARILAADHSGDLRALGEAKQSYIQELRHFGYGKESFLRSRRVDPGGLSGFIQTAPSSQGHPFEVAIGSEMLSSIRDEQLRRSLEAGEDVYAAVARHPVSHMPLMRVRVDRRLNPNVMGLDEGARGLLMADDDGDIFSMFFLNKNSDGWKEAQRAVTDPNSLQHRELRIQRALEGIEDDSRLAQDIAYKSVSGRQLGLDKSIEDISRARTAGGAVGRYSNILTDLMLGLESNAGVVNPEQRATMQRVFWALRQAPIAAQKSKAEGVRGLDDALKMANNLSYGLDNKTEKGFGVFYDSMLQIAGAFGRSMPYNDDMQLLGLNATMAVNGQINPLLKYVDANRDAFRTYHANRSPSTGAAARALTATEDAVDRFSGKMLEHVENMVPYLQEPVSSGGTASRMSAESLGAINEGLASVTREAKQVLRSPQVGGILAAGLGVAALAGLVTSSLSNSHSPSDFASRNANSYRPEATAGTSDHIPGEPVAGSMAPTSPPRRILPGRQGVRTALVAPVHQAVDLTVQTKATDRARATEQARLIARMSSDGDANVTVNVRQGGRRRSLRMREKMRDMNQHNR